mmetsp:Transcript_33744/g.73742  ORF Transcript_33744/g.73742 Transcript_33744/m.73742 type:complete len:361 (-) Transcript_33744:1262-2344(-)|eukprot:CAMPEP_0118927036 /NCGR_PEP_ID=MMETSP1169-20130426/4604_1 /TAXON_ID=36882 /ORGANISM="Pyramimonas obovata, Strain CCMP722" /LENGTH=360 /DNA_ID=CAMNT_0006868719 /DNA_START=75 /DNA_END=1157 /DNA_ORIENTATION=-
MPLVQRKSVVLLAIVGIGILSGTFVWIRSLYGDQLKTCISVNSRHDIAERLAIPSDPHVQSSSFVSPMTFQKVCERLLQPLNVSKLKEYLRVLREPRNPDLLARYWAVGLSGTRARRIKIKHCCSAESPATVVCRNFQRDVKGDGGGVCLDGHPMPKCVVYSFGIANDWTYDEAMAAQSCRVYSFDPTSAFEQVHKAYKRPNITFQYVGLAPAVRCGEVQSTGGIYGKLEGELLDLSAIRSRLGHTAQNSIKILKIDCEGCEWDVFYELAQNNPQALDGVNEVIIEVHQVQSLRMGTTADMVKFEAFFTFMFEKQGFKLWYHHQNKGARADRAVMPQLLQLGAVENICCYELGFVRSSFG